MKYINGYDGLYKIDFSGNIYREESIVYSDLRYTNGRKIKSNILKPHLGKNGYFSITLTKNGIQKRFYLHRLLAESFIDNPDNKPCINHKDGNKINNNLNNLEWVTYKENNIHNIETLNKVKRGYNKNNDLEIKIFELYNKGFNKSDIAKILNCSKPTVGWHINKRKEKI